MGDRTKERALDAYLVASARAGDRRAFGMLVRQWNGKLLAHAWHLLGDTEKARDAVQEGWKEIVRGLPKLTDPQAFPAWAYRIVSRRCGRLIGQACHERRLQEAVRNEPQERSYEPAGRLELSRIRKALDTLSAEQRAAIALFHLEELSVAEVAVALDVSIGTVKTRLMNARRRLRAALEGDEACVTSTD